MPGFRADPESLTDHGLEIEASEPFTALATAARHIEVPQAPAASSYAIERFVDRLAQDLAGLATATGSLGYATRSAAVRYQEVDESIRSMSTS